MTPVPEPPEPDFPPPDGDDAPSHPGLRGAAFAAAFPFYLEWDDSLVVTRVGPHAAKVVVGIAPGARLVEHVVARRPAGPITRGLFVAGAGTAMLLECKSSGAVLRGPVERIDGRYLFLASPWLAGPAELSARGYVASDFALHDQTFELLDVVRSHELANDDLKRLADRLTLQRAQLREKEAESGKLALIASRSANAILMTDALGRIEWTNEGFSRLSGWSLEELRGKTLTSFLEWSASDMNAVEHMRAQILRGEGFQTETLAYARDGRPYWVAVDAQPIFVEGQLAHFVAMGNDITERIVEQDRQALQIAASRALAKAGGLEAVMFDVLGVVGSRMGYTLGAAWALDGDSPSARLRVVASWERAKGMAGPFFLSCAAASFGVGEGLPGRVWAEGGTVVGADLSAVPGDPRAATAVDCGVRSYMAVPIVDGAAFLGVLELFGPVREMPNPKLVDALREIGHQLGAYAVRKRAEESLREAKEAAEAASRAKSEFLATMSHEIRTPMNGVLGFVQLLQQSPLTSQQSDFVASIRSSAESLLNVINDVLDFSKIESGHMEIERAPFSLEQCVEEAVETVAMAAGEKGLDLAARIDPAVPTGVLGDVLRVRQVLVNLLGNAVKFTSHGEVSLEVSSDAQAPDEVRFSVRDTGIGIPASKLESLFQPFHQVDSSTSRKYGGTGLGLAICRRLVGLMGGEITAASVPGRGAELSFVIPLPPSLGEARSAHSMQVPALVSRRAYVADAHPLSRGVIREMLERWGMDVRSGDSLRDAKTEGWSPHVVLLDCDVPSRESVDAVRGLAAGGATVLLMCSSGRGAKLREAYGAAISATLLKPLKVSPLFNLLVSHADRAGEKKVSRSRMVAPIVVGNRPLRLLLVEDNAVNRKLALAALAQLGCSADVAQNGREAIRAVKATRYDAIFMDVQMPGMDGIEATRAIRVWESDAGARPARIVALTANVLSGDRENCLRAGMDDYLPKPLRLDALRSFLQAVCDGRDAPTHESPVPPPPSSTVHDVLRDLVADVSLDEAVLLAKDYVGSLGDQLASLRRAIASGDLVVGARLAHSLKGSAAIFGLDATKACAAKVEAACRDGRSDEAVSATTALEAASRDDAHELDVALAALSDSVARMS
ncbi:MAG: response regulator [Polyangiaceae bacterium]